MEFSELSQLLISEFSLINIQANFEILSNYDLRLYRLNLKRSFLFSKPIESQPKIIEQLGGFMTPDQLKLVEENYIKILLDWESKNKAFINTENFLFSSDDSKIISRDGRVLVYSHYGKVPKDIMLNIASVALMMLSGNCDQAIGYDYVRTVMKNYGFAEFTFQMNGYLHIKLGENPKMQYRATTKLTNSKSK